MLDTEREDVDGRPDPPILLIEAIVQRVALLLGIQSNIVVFAHGTD